MNKKALILIILIVASTLPLASAININTISEGSLYDYFIIDRLNSQNDTYQETSNTFGTFTLTKFNDSNKANELLNNLTNLKGISSKNSTGTFKVDKLNLNSDNINYNYIQYEDGDSIVEIGHFKYKNHYYVYESSGEEFITPDFFIYKLK
ncbi:hypothetical protein [Methanobrevibacter sp. DSM 116169]|uniref:hypothetical protein n=1 Tax=Methanobrevibacter sp. DSM 116169 TaxID=3242727 RepID=UPI0038FC6DD9